jgi:hypothetical protein
MVKVLKGVLDQSEVVGSASRHRQEHQSLSPLNVDRD